MNQPSPGLYAAVLHAFSSTDPHSRPLDATMAELVDGLTSDHAELLPQAIGEVLPLLQGDPDRLRFAAEVALRLGVFEVAGAVSELALATGDRGLLLNAAGLCGNPAVSHAIRERVSAKVANDPPGRIRLDPDTVPATADEQRLYLQCWPGAREGKVPFALAPVVVLDANFDFLRLLKVAVGLDRRGAVVRRLSPNSEIPPWFGSQTVLVCQAPTRSRVLSRYTQFSEDQILVEQSLPENSRQLNLLLRKVNAALPRAAKLHPAPTSAELATGLWDPEVFTSGVYPTKDASFLTGASKSYLYGLRKRDLLRPRASTSLLWSFRDLVAVRTWAFLNSAAEKRISTQVIPALARFAGDPNAVRLGVMSNGIVHVDYGKGWINVVTGQRQLDLPITDIDDAFQPFAYGGGQVVAMLDASRNTRLHPRVLHGTPHLKDHRISAKALAALDQRGGHKAIERAYPELENTPISDTVIIGHSLLAA